MSNNTIKINLSDNARLNA